MIIKHGPLRKHLVLVKSLMYENSNSKRVCPPFNADSANLHITDRLKKQILIRKNLAPHELHFGMNTLSWPSFREEITSEKIFAKGGHVLKNMILESYNFGAIIKVV